VTDPLIEAWNEASHFDDWNVQVVYEYTFRRLVADELVRLADGLRVHATLKMPGVSDRAGRFAQTAVDDVKAELRARADELRGES
jgi:hypothetical protein